MTPASRPPTGSLRRARCLRARRRPGPWPGDSDVTYPSPARSRRHGADHGDHGDHGGHGGHGNHGAGRGGPLTLRRREPGSGIHKGGRVGQNNLGCELTEMLKNRRLSPRLFSGSYTF